MAKYIEKLTFYANSRNYENRLFSFRVVSPDHANNILNHFAENGNYIKSAFVKGMEIDKFSNRLPVLFQYRVGGAYLGLLNSGFRTSVTEFNTDLI